MAGTGKKATADGVAQSKPGDVISPSGAQPPATQAKSLAKPKPETSPQPVSPISTETPPAQAIVSDSPAEPTLSEVDDSPAPDGDGISWTASEFIAHEKSFGWYMMLALVTLAFAAAIYLLTKDPISTGVVIIGAFILGIYGARKPRQLEYRMDTSGLGIGRKYHNYEEFRSFAIVPEGVFSSIVFMPLKRFGTPTIIYYDPKDEDAIVSLLSDRLPLEEHRHDAVDHLMRYIRF